MHMRGDTTRSIKLNLNIPKTVDGGRADAVWHVGHVVLQYEPHGLHDRTQLRAATTNHLTVP